MACHPDRRGAEREGAMPARSHHSPRAERAVRLGDPQLDRYLEFVESRARHNTLLATVSDLKAFFGVSRTRDCWTPNREEPSWLL